MKTRFIFLKMSFAQAVWLEAPPVLLKISALVTTDAAGSSAGELSSVSAGTTAGTGSTPARQSQFGHLVLMVLSSGLVVSPLSTISLSFYPGRKFRVAEVVRSPLTRKQRSSLFVFAGEMLTGGGGGAGEGGRAGQSGKLPPDSSFGLSGQNQQIWVFLHKKKIKEKTNT